MNLAIILLVKRLLFKVSIRTILHLIRCQTNIRNVREEHRHLIPKDHGVYPIPGDGSCFFGSVAAHIYQDETQVSILRRLCHYFMVENWWYFQFFIPLPFMETVGVGAESYRVFP